MFKRTVNVLDIWMNAERSSMSPENEKCGENEEGENANGPKPGLRCDKEMPTQRCNAWSTTYRVLAIRMRE